MSQETYRKERNVDAMIALGLALLAALLYLPFLGAYPLWDPWEAHYSQVAMEMVHHNSWWEPWYRKSTTSFWSKPILTFWLMVSSLKTFRINQVGSFAHAEFFLRLPIALMGATGVAFMFFFARRMWNRRTGVVAALILATCPQYFLISRQVMVDIPFVVIQFMALGFFALGMFDPRPDQDDDTERAFGIKLFRNLALVALGAQIIEWLYWRFKLLPNIDLGSLLSFGGAAWATEAGYWRTTMAQGSYHWLAFAVFFFIWMIVRANNRSPKSRFFYLFFFMSGLGFLAKGLLSIVVPGGAVLFYILLSRDWDLLRRMRLIYSSDKLPGRSAVALGVVASLAAVWFITYPMMTGLLAIPLKGLSKNKQIQQLKRHEQEHNTSKALVGMQPQLQQLQLKQDAQMAAVQQHHKTLQTSRKALVRSDVKLRKARATWRAAQNRLKRMQKRKFKAAALAKQKTKVSAARQVLNGAQAAYNKANQPIRQSQRGLAAALAQASTSAKLGLGRAKAGTSQAKAAALKHKWASLWKKRLALDSRLYNLQTQRQLKGEKLHGYSAVWRGLLVYNVLATVQGWYRTFSKKNLYQQIGWFSVIFLGFLGLAVLLGGMPKFEGFKALLLAVPAFAIVQQTGLGLTMGITPVVGGWLVFTVMTFVVFVIGKRQHNEDLRRFSSTGLMFAAIAGLPMAAKTIFVTLSFVPTKVSPNFVGQGAGFSGLVYVALFTLLFAAVVALVAYQNDATTKESFAPFRRPVMVTYFVMLGAWLLLAFRVERVHEYKLAIAGSAKTIKGALFGLDLLLMLAMIVAVVAVGVLFRGEEGKERFKAYFLSGAFLYLLVAGSWVYVMDLRHGLRFMDEWFIRHHFARFQGVIEKPNNSFDLYIKQIAFGMFPWSALVPIAMVRLLRWNWRDLLDQRSLRNLFFFCCFFFPYVFYTFSSTKFHHYIFPVIPFLALIVGVWVARLFREDGIAKDRIGVGVSLLLFALLAKDLMTNFKPLHQLFTYYTNRATPGEVFPRNTFMVIFAVFGLIFLTILLVRRLRPTHFGLLMIPVCLFVLFVNVRLIPAVAKNYSFKSVWTTYQKIDDKRILKALEKKKKAALASLGNANLKVSLSNAFDRTKNEVHRNLEMRKICQNFHRFAKADARMRLATFSKANRGQLLRKLSGTLRSHDPCRALARKPFGENANWDERSTSFYSNNFSKHIGKTWQIKSFLKRHRDLFVMVDRGRLPTMRRIAKKLKRKLYIVARPNYKMWLISTSPVSAATSVGSVVHKKAPKMVGPNWKRVNINFGDKLRMVAVRVSKPKGYRRGDKVQIIFVFKCLKKIKRDWKVFIHADPVTWARNRLNWDHLMAEGSYSTNEWKPGEYIFDVVNETLPRSYPTHYNKLHINMGLWLGNDRLPVRSSSVYHDGQNRVRPITLKLIP